MSDNLIGLMGLGAVGAPVAHRLFEYFGSSFVLLTDLAHEGQLRRVRSINGAPFDPAVVCTPQQLRDATGSDKLDVLLISVKNYDLISAVSSADSMIGPRTVLVPMENGIWATRYLRHAYPKNVVLECFIQGPNTRRTSDGFEYTRSGAVHMGTSRATEKDTARATFDLLAKSPLDVSYEEDIQRMVWKKWMLNVAGNPITALTGASYSDFEGDIDLQVICRKVMREFLLVSNAMQVDITYADIDEVIDYFVGYKSGKVTSMLEDVTNHNRTENEYITGELLRMGEETGIDLPLNRAIYTLMKTKESVYLQREENEQRMKSDAIAIKTSVKNHMIEIEETLEHDPLLAMQIREYSVPALRELLNYAREHSAYYRKLFEDREGEVKLTEFPVMNKTILNEHYDEVFVEDYRGVKTHLMHTSGSTGIPFTVVQNLEKRDRHIADLKYFGELAGYHDHDPLCYLRAKPTATQAEQEAQNIWQLDITNLSEKNLTYYYQVMLERGCTALMGYPSTLATAVRIWSQKFTNQSKIRTIISTSETLTAEVREQLHDFFGPDVDIVARYSNTENGILGQETSMDHYVMNWASYFFEILKFDSDEPAAPGELGRIVVTDLYNLAFPMIRYDTGDVGKLEFPEVEQGAEMALPYITSLFGRRMDLIYDTRGEVVSPFLLCRTMRLTHGIEQWQFIQKDPTHYVIRVAVTHGEPPKLDNEVAQYMETLGADANISVEYVNEIPVMNSLKRKLIVSEL